jgi:hypothetical protein
MTNMPKIETVLVFKVVREYSNSIYVDRLWIAEYETADAAERLAGTIDNRAGYGSAEAAARMGKVFTAMLADGHTKFFDYSVGFHSLSIRHQVYRDGDAERPQYCSPRFEWPSGIRSCKWAMKLVERIGRRVEKEDARRRSEERGYQVLPSEVRDDSLEQLQDVLAVLRKIGAIEVKSWSAPDDGPYPHSYNVPA